MVKKKFIDKKKAVTYSLVYRSTEDADAPLERELMEASRGTDSLQPEVEAADQAHEATTAGRRYPPGHPLAWLEEEQAGGESITDGRRHELVELGFPDDGYDYLRHVRTLGRGGASLEGMPAASAAMGGGASSSSGGGGGVFMPAQAKQAPKVDVAVFDAAELTVMQPTEADAEAARLMGGVTAFSHRKDDAGPDRREIDEVEAAMRELEEDDFEEVETDDEAAGAGEGDLLDDFVVAATLGGEDAAANGSGGAAGSEGSWSSEDEYEVYSDDFSGSEEGGGGGSGAPPPRPGSIASTYWREERHDRRNLLEAIDERFENLALEYDEDEIGSMEDAAEAGEICGGADPAQFNAMFDEFLAERRTLAEDGAEEKNGEPPAVVPGGRRRGESHIKAHMDAAGFADDDAEVAVTAARAAVRRAEEEEAAGTYGRVNFESVEPEADPTAGWDCESVLSLRSNLYNHPSTIGEPRNSRTGPLRLNKMGIPVAGLPTHRAEEKAQKERAAAAIKPAVPEIVIKPRKGETAEEKKARKAAVKEAKRDARATKKELKELYKQEGVKAAKRVATAQVQPAVLL